MKLRIRGNSIRLRLLRGEVTEFARQNIISETISFGASKLIYTLQTATKNSATELSAEFSEGEIAVFVPPQMAREWTETDLVTLNSEQRISDVEVLKILVEKDFVCLDRPDDEDNKDAYPNLTHKC